MRFESMMWAVLALLLSGGVGWDGGSAQPVEDTELFEATDGCSIIPPKCQ